MIAAAPAQACSIKQALPSQRNVVSVNGVVIPHTDIARETQNHPAGRPVEAWQSATRALVIRELLLQEARRVGVPAEVHLDDEGRRETDEEAMIRGLVERHVIMSVPSEETCRRYYDQNRLRFRSPDLFEVRHILLSAPPGDAQTLSSALQLAERLIATLRQQPEAFAELAQAHSACPSRTVGGSLGQVGPGQTVPEFERALASLEVGSIGLHPIETRYGVHVVALDRRIEGVVLPFEHVRKRIASWLGEKDRRLAIREYIASLANKARIDGIGLAGSSST